MIGARDDLGLTIDMLDVDRLRDWARLLLINWAAPLPPSVAGQMQIMATSIEKAVRDIGTLRSERDNLRAALVGIVGVDGRADLEQMEGVMRLMPAPAADKAATIDAITRLIGDGRSSVKPSEGCSHFHLLLAELLYCPNCVARFYERLPEDTRRRCEEIARLAPTSRGDLVEPERG